MTVDPGNEGRADDRHVDLLRELEALRRQRDLAWMQIEQMRSTASWRLTAPMRRLTRAVRNR